MEIDGVKSVGCCIHESRQGLMALDFALGLAGRLSVPVSAYRFQDSPFEPAPSDDEQGTWYGESAMTKEDVIPHVSFVNCQGPAWDELHRRYGRQEFQVMVLPLLDYNTTFQGRHLQEIALRFLCPTVLVGPCSTKEYYPNKPATKMLTEFESCEGFKRRVASSEELCRRFEQHGS